MIGELEITEIISYCVVGWMVFLGGILLGIRIFWRDNIR